MIAQVCSQMPPQTVVHIVSKNTSSAVHFVSNNTTCSSPPLPYVLTVYCERINTKREPRTCPKCSHASTRTHHATDLQGGEGGNISYSSKTSKRPNDCQENFLFKDTVPQDVSTSRFIHQSISSIPNHNRKYCI